MAVILIVEDDVFIREVAEMIIQDLGHQILTASDVDEALSILSPGLPFALCSLGFFQDAIGLSRGRNYANGTARLKWLVSRISVCKANANLLTTGRPKQHPFAEFYNGFR